MARNGSSHDSRDFAQSVEFCLSRATSFGDTIMLGLIEQLTKCRRPPETLDDILLQIADRIVGFPGLGETHYWSRYDEEGLFNAHHIYRNLIHPLPASRAILCSYLEGLWDP